MQKCPSRIDSLHVDPVQDKSSGDEARGHILWLVDAGRARQVLTTATAVVTLSKHSTDELETVVLFWPPAA